MASREGNEKNARKDFVQAFVELKKKDQENSKIKLCTYHLQWKCAENSSVPFCQGITEDLIVGQAVTFITDGTETSATVMSYTLYELARNPEVQKKVQDEIDRVIEENGQMTDEGIMQLELLDRCIHENLRLHPVTFNITRICTKPFELPPQFPNEGQPVTISAGTPIIIPISAIHM